MVVLGPQIAARRMPRTTNARLIAGVFLCAPAAGLRRGRAADRAAPRQVAARRARARPTDPTRRSFRRREYQCGPAALATALAYFKVPVTADDLVTQVYIPARKGSVQAEMLAAPRRYGMVSYALAPRFDDVLREVADGTPVVVLQNYGVGPLQLWHYATAVGYNAQVGSLTLRSGERENWWMPLAIFEYTWHDSGYWAMVAVPPDRIPATADRRRYLEAIVAFERAGNPQASVTAYTPLSGTLAGRARRQHRACQRALRARQSEGDCGGAPEGASVSPRCRAGHEQPRAGAIGPGPQRRSARRHQARAHGGRTV